MGNLRNGVYRHWKISESIQEFPRRIMWLGILERRANTDEAHLQLILKPGAIVMKQVANGCFVYVVSTRFPYEGKRNCEVQCHKPSDNHE